MPTPREYLKRASALFRGVAKAASNGLTNEQRDLMRRPPMFFPLGISGPKRRGKLVDEEFLSDLKGAKGAKVYREMMENHPIIGSALWVTELMLGRTKYRIEPANDSPQAKEAADFCQTVIDDMDGGMRGLLSEMLTAAPYGWAWLEKQYKIRRGPEHMSPQLRSRYTDGKIGIRRIGLIGQDTLHEWIWDENDEIVGMVQQPPAPYSGMRTIPRSKSLHVRFKQSKNSPEGRSALRTAYTSYYYQKNFQFVESVGIERDLAGYPRMEVPPEVLESQDPATKAVLDSYFDLVRKIKRDEFEGIVVPSEDGPDGKTGYRFGLVSSGGRRPADVDPVIKRLDSRIAMCLLAEFLVVGLDKTGSFSLHSDKTSLYATAIGYYLDERDRQLNDEVFPDLMRLNGYAPELTPRCVHGDIEKTDLTVLGSFIASVVGSGVVTVDDRLEEWVREAAGLPEADLSTSRSISGPELPMMGAL